MAMTSPSSPSSRIAHLFDRLSVSAEDLEQVLELPPHVTAASVLSGAYELSPTDLAAVAESLDVPVSVLAGLTPVERNFGVSLRMGDVSVADVPEDALDYVGRVFEYKTLLDSWLGEIANPLARVDMSADRYFVGAGRESAERVRDGLGIDAGPIADLVGLVEGFGIPVISLNLPDDIHGLNVKDERQGTAARIIVVSTNDGWARQRFTLAHELCHALYGDEGRIIIDRVDVPDALPELRAESFARHLLLPSKSLLSEVQAARRQGLRWPTIVANLMIRWGVSRLAILRALTDDQLISPSDLDGLKSRRIDSLMSDAGILNQWNLLSTDQHEQAGSPSMVQRAVEAYGNGWVGLHVVADLLGQSIEQTRNELAHQGWMED